MPQAGESLGSRLLVFSLPLAQQSGRLVPQSARTDRQTTVVACLDEREQGSCALNQYVTLTNIAYIVY